MAYYLHNAGGHDVSSHIARTDVLTVPGETYTVDFELGSGSEAGFGITFGGQTPTWSYYSGYLLLFEDTQTRLDRHNNGEIGVNVSGAAIPTGERLTAEISFRDGDDNITCRVYDSGGSEITSLQLDNETEYGEGYPGFYHWHDDDYRVYSYEQSSYSEPEVTPSLPSELDINGSVDIDNTNDTYNVMNLRDDTRVWVREGETINNILVNTNGYEFNVQAEGLGDFEIRNFGVSGSVPETQGPIFYVGVSGTGTLENIYLGDGGNGVWQDKHVDGELNTHPKAIFTFSSHTGTLNVRNFYAGPFPDNVFYCESQGSGGDIHFENVYVYGGCVSVFRTGGNGDHTLRNCHAENAGYHPQSSHGGARDVWLRSGTGSPELDVYGSHLGGSGSGIIADAGPVRLREGTQYGGGRGDIREMDSNVGQSPSPSVPADTPESAVEAASAGDTEPSEPTRPSDRFVSGQAEGEYDNIVYLLNNEDVPIDYSLYVDRDLVMNDIDNAEWNAENITWDDGESYEGVTGTVPQGMAHSFFFNGDLLAADASDTFSWSGLNRDGAWAPTDEPNDPPEETTDPLEVSVNAPAEVEVGNNAVFNVEVVNNTDQDKVVTVEVHFSEL